MAHELSRLLRIAVCRVAAGVKFFSTKETGAAGNVEGNDYAIADFLRLHIATDLDHFTHRLVPKNVTFLHRRHIAVHEMKVRPANRRRGDFHDHIARIFYLWIRDRVAANISNLPPLAIFDFRLAINDLGRLGFSSD